jgi:hypothetical protein
MTRPTQFEKMRANRVKLAQAQVRAIKAQWAREMRDEMRKDRMTIPRFSDVGRVVEFPPIRPQPWWRLW